MWFKADIAKGFDSSETPAKPSVLLYIALFTGAQLSMCLTRTHPNYNLPIIIIGECMFTW